MKLFGIYDRAIQSFTGAPFTQPTNAAALRVIKQEASREGSQLATNPEDFELYELGTYNEQTGEITPQKQLVVRIQDLNETKA